MSTRVKVVVQRMRDNVAGWPCINFDYEKETKRIMDVVAAGNPETKFDVVYYTSMQQAHLNTSQTTHKYDIKKSDADEFLRKVKCDPSFMAESKGLFSSRYEHPKRFEPLNVDKEGETKRDLNEKYSHAVSYFTYLWRDQPDILRATAAADLIGANRQYIRRKQESDELNVVMIRGTLMLSKRELIRFVCTKNHIFNPPTIKLKELIAQI